MILLVEKITTRGKKTKELPHVTDKLDHIKTPSVRTAV